MVTVWEIRMAEVNIVHNATNAQRKIKLLKKKIKKKSSQTLFVVTHRVYELGNYSEDIVKDSLPVGPCLSRHLKDKPETTG